MDLDREQLETIDVVGWRTTDSIWKLLGVIVYHFQCSHFRPDPKDEKTRGRILAQEVVGFFIGLCYRVSESSLVDSIL